MTQPLTLPMIRTRWGRIINIAVGRGADGQQGPGELRRRQGRAQQRHQSPGLELAIRGITVNAVAPGIIQSPMADAVFDAELIKRMVPTQRAGSA